MRAAGLAGGAPELFCVDRLLSPDPLVWGRPVAPSFVVEGRLLLPSPSLSLAAVDLLVLGRTQSCLELHASPTFHHNHAHARAAAGTPFPATRETLAALPPPLVEHELAEQRRWRRSTPRRRNTGNLESSRTAPGGGVDARAALGGGGCRLLWRVLKCSGKPGVASPPSPSRPDDSIAYGSSCLHIHPESSGQPSFRISTFCVQG